MGDTGIEPVTARMVASCGYGKAKGSQTLRLEALALHPFCWWAILESNQ